MKKYLVRVVFWISVLTFTLVSVLSYGYHKGELSPAVFHGVVAGITAGLSVIGSILVGFEGGIHYLGPDEDAGYGAIRPSFESDEMTSEFDDRLDD